MKILKTGAVPVAYIDEGNGPPVILAHCSSATHRLWRPLIDTLKTRHRVLAPDLIGYGASGKWPAGKPFSFSEDARILGELAAMTGEPVHFAGHSYGAAMILEAALHMETQPRGLTLIEPVAFPILPHMGRNAEWMMVDRLAADIEDALERNDRERMAKLYMNFWIGPVRWFFAPRKIRDRVMQTVEKVALEFSAMRSAPTPSLEKLRGLDCPTLLAYGTKTRKVAKSVIEALAELVPHARIKQIPGAGHMSPLTHQVQVNQIIEAHIAECVAIAGLGDRLQTAARG
jgi:pimeloyl-ACP methyl ester carboxylesterase